MMAKNVQNVPSVILETVTVLFGSGSDIESTSSDRWLATELELSGSLGGRPGIVKIVKQAATLIRLPPLALTGAALTGGDNRFSVFGYRRGDSSFLEPECAL
jgi:hypothetical protein